MCSIEEMRIFPYAKDCVRQIKKKGYYTIVITNQSGVARGLFTEEMLIEMNNYLQKNRRGCNILLPSLSEGQRREIYNELQLP